MEDEIHTYKKSLVENYEILIYPTIRTQLRKKYISAAIWNYIHTPINFIISLFTGLTAGQAGSSTSYLSKDTVFIMLFVCFILSTVNIFFKLREKAELNYLSAKSFETFINEYISIQLLPYQTSQEIDHKINEYKALKTKIDTYMAQEKIDSVNYFTECIYFLVQKYKSRKTLNMLFDNATSENNEIYKNRFDILRDMRHKGVISKEELMVITSQLEEKLKANTEKTNSWAINWISPRRNHLIDVYDGDDSSLTIPQTPNTINSKNSQPKSNRTQHANTLQKSPSLDIGKLALQPTDKSSENIKLDEESEQFWDNL